MEGPVPTAPTGSSTNARSGHGRGRGRRRGRGDRSTNADTSRPSDSAPGQPGTPNPTSVHSRPNRRGRGGGGGGGEGRPPAERLVNGRQFGGRLTHEPPDSTPAPQLHPSAIAFVPGQLYVRDPTKAQKGPSRPPPKQSRPPKERAPKSQAPDIATRTHEDIDHGHYECPICTSEVERKNKVWSCNLCWTVFHLSCIKKWSTNEGSSAAQQQPQSGDSPPVRQWRCPGCNLPKDELPGQYTCWCGKEIEPRAPTGLPPHSCGQSCSKPRPGKCPHPHTGICHAGPCPPCAEMGPTQICYCGKHSTTKLCVQTNYDSGWSCGELCNELMPCGEHRCSRPCHAGSCGACEVRVPARCYCGQCENDIVCAERAEPRQSKAVYPVDNDTTMTETWTGSFVCGNTCNRLYDCGNHRCEQVCHPQDLKAAHCPLSPDIVSRCACGKTPIDMLMSQPRTWCLDPIPSCSQPCNKLLLCGHECAAVCHSNTECPPCTRKIDLKCRCGRTSSRTLCHQGKEEAPQCMRVCRITLHCGRHACDEHCCSGEKKALERQAAKRKHRPLNAGLRPLDDGFEPEHICTRMCGKLLTCGIHRDEGLCHKGPCGTCREAIFEEISCHCGRTVVQPPLPCGTPPPPCRYPCNRPKSCGHPQVAHNCHQDSESCPRCPFLVEKRCLCGKKTLKNQQCWLAEVRCGEMCGRLLKCGSHRCRKQCHAPGECEDSGGSCQQPCGKPKPICGHPDETICHGVFACKQDKPCQNKIFITCECQAQKQEMKCGASKVNDGNASKTLLCNDECARLERNRRLAVALNIDQSTHVDGLDHVPYSTDTLNTFAQHVKWCQEQEREFRVFATSSEEKRIRFKPMKPQQRQFIHLLAEDFGLDSESMDPEPNRHVMIWKTPRFVSAPNKTLAESLRIRSSNRPSTAVSSANVSDNEGPLRKPKASNEVGEPFNSFLLTNPRFALTVDELDAELNTVLPPSDTVDFGIAFLPNEEVVFRATSLPSLPPHDLQDHILPIFRRLSAIVSAKNYGTLHLATTDSSLNVSRKGQDVSSAANADGWSRVAAGAKKAGSRVAVQQQNGFGSTENNAFAALTGTVTFAKKKRPLKKESIVDDWEAAETAEEEKEQNVATAAEPESTDEGGEQKEAVNLEKTEAMGITDWAEEAEQEAGKA